MCAHSRPAAGWIPGGAPCRCGLDVVDPAGIGGVREGIRDADQWPTAADSRPEAATGGTYALGAIEGERGERAERPTAREEDRKLPSNTHCEGPAKHTGGQEVREERDGSGGGCPSRAVLSEQSVSGDRFC